MNKTTVAREKLQSISILTIAIVAFATSCYGLVGFLRGFDEALFLFVSFTIPFIPVAYLYTHKFIKNQNSLCILTKKAFIITYDLFLLASMAIIIVLASTYATFLLYNLIIIVLFLLIFTLIYLFYHCKILTSKTNIIIDRISESRYYLNGVDVFEEQNVTKISKKVQILDKENHNQVLGIAPNIVIIKGKEIPLAIAILDRKKDKLICLLNGFELYKCLSTCNSCLEQDNIKNQDVNLDDVK